MKIIAEHRRHVLDDALLRLDEPCGHDHRAGGARRDDPLGDALDVDARGLEDSRGQPHEHAAAERDQHVVDEPLAREADEVHASLVRAERAAHVRVRDDEPQHDGQVNRGQHLGVRVRIPRIEVHEERGERERRGRERPAAQVELPPAREVAGEERQHEETEVPREPRRLLVGEVRGEAGDLERDGRAEAEQERLEPAAHRAHRLVAAAQDELLPEPPAVLARELAGERVEVAHPLHGDEERLVVREASLVQLRDLAAEVVLELVDVAAVHSGAPATYARHSLICDSTLSIKPPPPPAARRRSARASRSPIAAADPRARPARPW